jgi:RNA polymerase sigma-70 factor (ECF subfamily)
MAADHAPITNHGSPGEIVSAEELERLYRTGFHQYLRVAEAITGSPENALDAVQEGFARALHYLRDFRGESQLSTWVWTCVVNAAKTARPRGELHLDEKATDTATTEDRPSPPLRGLIASLPERQRHALFLRYYADLDYQAIAAVLDVRVGTVGATLNKAHDSLRRQLKEVSP